MFKMKKEGQGYSMETEFGELLVSTNADHGFRPVQLMAASIAGCSLATLESILAKMEIDFVDLDVTIDVERSGDKVNQIEKIHLHYVITGDKISLDKVEKAGEISRRYCAMIQSVEASIQVTESFEVK